MSKIKERAAKSFVFERKPSTKQPDAIPEDEIASSLSGLSLLGAGARRQNIGFEDMGLSENVLKGIAQLGLDKPTVAQVKAIGPIVKGRDVIFQAQSGMGKTAAFCIGVLQRINIQKLTIQALVMVPTRELAAQVQQVFITLGGPMNLSCITCVGGHGLVEEKNALAAGVHIVIGTYGRILSYADSKVINLSEIEMFVLDEADKMITGSFFQPMQKVMKMLSGDAQCILASATMSPGFHESITSFMRDPVKILMPNVELTLDGIKQYYISTEGKHSKTQLETLVDIYPHLLGKHALVFCRTRENVKILKNALSYRGINVCKMMGTMHQHDRTTTLEEYRRQDIRFIVTTDLLGRGIDVQQVFVVINYGLKLWDYETYIHRVGRAGRFGRKGVVINLLTDLKDMWMLKKLEAFYNTEIPEMTGDIKDILS